MGMVDSSDEKPVRLPLVILQMAVSAIAFVIVLGTMALVMPLWQLSRRLVSSGRHYYATQRDAVAPVFVIEQRGDMRAGKLHESRERKAYCRLLCYFLTEEVRAAFKEQHERPTPRIAELIRQLDQVAPAIQPLAR
jgi:hypothetical protein